MDLSGWFALARLPLAGLAVAAACARGPRGPRGGAPAATSIAFDDVTRAARIANRGRSFGAAVGDFDGDGFDDLFFGNHYHDEKSGGGVALFRNRGDRTFEEVAARTFRGTTHGDLHGGAWADFDGDGDQDLLVLTGAEFGHGSDRKLLFVNDAPSRTLTERGESLGFVYRESRGRTPLWIPSPQAGGLDVLVTALHRPDGHAPTALFRRGPSGKFEVASIGPDPLPEDNCFFAQLSDLDDDGRLEVVLHGQSGPRVVAVGDRPGARDATAFELPNVEDMSDCAIADFDGDQLQDLFVVACREAASADLFAPNRVDVAFVVKERWEGLSFACDAPEIHVTSSDASAMAPVVRIGAAGSHPVADAFDARRSDGVAPAHGRNVAPGERGLDVGFDAATARWHVVALSSEWWGPTLSITASAPIHDLAFEKFAPGEGRRVPALLLHESGRKLTNAAKRAGLTTPLTARAVVAGDFDNDTDVDLFVVQSSRTANLPDLLLENRGDGTFEFVPDAGGAAGTAGGYGDSAVVLDFDRDGFLDLLVTNGEGSGIESAAGATQLFRNRGNANHWLEIDLVGTVSNRDGIGARVTLQAGGRTQLREQGGAMHRFSQNSKRLHFGLGSATSADRIVVRWPSGIAQTLTSVAADQILTVREPPR